MAGELKGKRVAFLFTEGAEQVEVTEPLDALKKWQRPTASTRPPVPRRDCHVADFIADERHCLIIQLRHHKPAGFPPRHGTFLPRISINAFSGCRWYRVPLSGHWLAMCTPSPPAP